MYIIVSEFVFILEIQISKVSHKRIDKRLPIKLKITRFVNKQKYLEKSIANIEALVGQR